MAAGMHRWFLERLVGRIFAAVVALGSVAALVYIERERLWQPRRPRRPW
jgi:hypothetical protein